MCIANGVGRRVAEGGADGGGAKLDFGGADIIEAGSGSGDDDTFVTAAGIGGGTAGERGIIDAGGGGTNDGGGASDEGGEDGASDEGAIDDGGEDAGGGGAIESARGARGARPVRGASGARIVAAGRGRRDAGSALLCPSASENAPMRKLWRARTAPEARPSRDLRFHGCEAASTRRPRAVWAARDPGSGARTIRSRRTCPTLNRSAVNKAERRQQILSNARDVFAKRGYHAAKIDDIVAAAGVARGTFYLYFDDKRAIFEEIVDGTFARLGAAVMRVDTEDPSKVVGQIEENIRRIVHALLEDPATTKILLSDAVGLDPGFDKKLLFFYEEVGKLLEASLADGQERGIVAAGDARVYAIMTLGAVKEIMYQVVMRGLDYPEERIVAEIFRFLAAGYLRVTPR